MVLLKVQMTDVWNITQWKTRQQKTAADVFCYVDVRPRHNRADISANSSSYRRLFIQREQEMSSEQLSELLFSTTPTWTVTIREHTDAGSARTAPDLKNCENVAKKRNQADDSKRCFKETISAPNTSQRKETASNWTHLIKQTQNEVILYLTLMINCW